MNKEEAGCRGLGPVITNAQEVFLNGPEQWNGTWFYYRMAGSPFRNYVFSDGKTTEKGAVETPGYAQ